MKNLQVAMIDNSFLDLSLFKRGLVREGFEFHGFDNLNILLMWLETATPDIILVDLAMPIDGIEVAERICNLRLTAKVAFITGQEVDGVIKQAQKLYGVERAFLKNNDFSRLAEDLRQWLLE